MPENAEFSPFMQINIPESDQKRVVIIGGGFAGLTLARELAKLPVQLVLIDKHNYHQFQPLFYQVAMAGLEPSSIVFPLRKTFQNKKNVFIRVSEVRAVRPDQKEIETTLGPLTYDYLVLAMGANTNFFGNENLARRAFSMKTVSEALLLRNSILEDLEKALSTPEYDERQGLIDIVIVGGGPTGVELAGALAEMKKYILPKDYPELDTREVDIHLIQSGDHLLKGMSSESSAAALRFLTEMGVHVRLNARVTDYDGKFVYTKDGDKIRANKVIWAAGIIGNAIEGLPASVLVRGNRIRVTPFLEVEGCRDIFAIGDLAFLTDEDYPHGHSQVAQVAIQQAKTLARNFKRQLKNQPPEPFRYKDLGSMATIGRHRAVVDLPRWKFQGFFAWLIWLGVHLFQLIGVKNKLFVFINWVWNYLTYDQSLRLIIRAKSEKNETSVR